MKIGITIPYASVNYSGGLNVQCRMWQEGLMALGHQVDLLNPWDKFNYNSYDYLIIVGVGKLLLDYVKLFRQFERPKILSAPVLDPDVSVKQFRLRSKYYGCLRIHCHMRFHDYYMCRGSFAFFLVRSEYEKKYIVDGLGVPADKVHIVPISIRFVESPIFDIKEKENVCLHVSRLADPNKNVKKLVEAAKKYKFRLKLAGTLNGARELNWMENLLDDAPSVEYLGWLDEKALINEYKKAKAFSLPSLVEGVGMVALEAASYGCEICLTNLGGPKEYYEDRAVLVDPYDIDSIGKGILEVLGTKKAQPELSRFVLEKYSVNKCMKQLESIMYNNL